MANYTAAQFIKAIEDSGGIISTIARRVGCDWHTAKRYIEEYATVQQAYQDERNKVIDIAIGVSNTGDASWVIPNSLTEGTRYRVRVIDTLNTSVFDESDGDFAINSQ